MFRKSFLNVLLLIFVALGSGLAANAQSSVSGTVELDNNGTRTLLAGAKVDLFREDIKGKGQSVTTGADGKFSFANVESGFKYLILVSGPGASPNYFPDVTAGMQGYLAIVGPGKGETLTEDQLKTTIDKMSAEEKKKQSEETKKAQEVLAKNKRIENSTKLNQLALDKGIPALSAKKYDEAIAMFDAAIDGGPAFEGSTPVFLNAKGVGLKSRARDGIVAAQKGDAAAKAAAREKATPDYLLAISSFDRGLEIIAKAPADTTAKTVMVDTKHSIYTNYVLALSEMYETSIPVPETVDATKILIEYIATETDLKKRQTVLLSFGDKAMRGGVLESAAIAFKKALEFDPKDLEALSGAAVAVGAMAFMDSPPDAVKMQEASKFGKQYLDSAPKDHKNQAAVVDIMDNIKGQNSSKKN